MAPHLGPKRLDEAVRAAIMEAIGEIDMLWLCLSAEPTQTVGRHHRVDHDGRSQSPHTVRMDLLLDVFVEGGPMENMRGDFLHKWTMATRLHWEKGGTYPIGGRTCGVRAIPGSRRSLSVAHTYATGGAIDASFIFVALGPR
jgi:hypothetical protein